MIETTESESMAELDRFRRALVAIRGEIADVASGVLPRDDNPLIARRTRRLDARGRSGRGLPARAGGVPAPWVARAEVLPSVGRVDNAYGDRHLVCSFPPVEEYASVRAERAPISSAALAPSPRRRVRIARRPRLLRARATSCGFAYV